MSNTIKVKIVNGIKNENWLRHFAPGSEIEVVRETKVHKIIAPMGFELKVIKRTGQMSDFKSGEGVIFEVE